MTLFMFIYYAGIASCGMQGAKKSMGSLNLVVILIISPLLTSFGGGFVRDTSFLSVFPVVFTPGCIPDILDALFAAFIYLKIQNVRNLQKKSYMQKTMKWFIDVTDASSLGAFISMGAEKSIMMDADPSTTLCCGIVTSLGGGVLSSVFCGIPVWNVLSSNVLYHVIAILGSTIYTFWRYAGIKHSVAQYAIVFYTTVSVLACNQMVKQWIKKFLESFSRSEFICYILFIPYKTEMIKPPCMQIIYYLHSTYKVTYTGYTEIRRRVILFHRILQM